MRTTDAQQRRLLDQLREADGRPIAFADLRSSGVDFPAVVVAELELNGYRIERVRDRERIVGVRLHSPEPTETPDKLGRTRRTWRHRHASTSGKHTA